MLKALEGNPFEVEYTESDCSQKGFLKDSSIEICQAACSQAFYWRGSADNSNGAEQLRDPPITVRPAADCVQVGDLLDEMLPLCYSSL